MCAGFFLLATGPHSQEVVLAANQAEIWEASKMFHVDIGQATQGIYG